MHKSGQTGRRIPVVMNEPKDLECVEDKAKFCASVELLYFSIQESIEVLVNAALSTHSGYLCTTTQARGLSQIADLSDARKLDWDERKLDAVVNKV